MSAQIGRRRRSAAARVTRPAPRATLSVLSVTDGLTHEVDELEVLAGRGRYTAVCGEMVSPAALTEATGRRCRGCAAAFCPDLADVVAECPSRGARRARSVWLGACAVVMQTALRRPTAVSWV
ncbi:MAG: hypothetical protein AB7N73_12305 [Gemmatimonadales bacterium]